MQLEEITSFQLATYHSLLIVSDKNAQRAPSEGGPLRL